ncbi:MAG: c-type cytochrome [Tahibacter sp.]
MTFPGIRAWQMMMATLCCAGWTVAMAGGVALDTRNVPALHGDAKAGAGAAVTCVACHGAKGISPIPTFPHLAGQRAEYLYWKLVQFQREARTDSPMSTLAATLTEPVMRDLAAYFSALPPKSPLASADATDPGGTLYNDGDPARGVPPCQGCHGTAGSGHPLSEQAPRYRMFPVLQGQHAAYIAQRLEQFQSGKRRYTSSENIMAGVVHGLTAEDMRNLAAWLEGR